MRCHPLPWALCLAPLLAGCSTIRTAERVADAVFGSTQESVSFTVRGGPPIAELAEGLGQFDVQAHVEAVETGIAIVEIVGTLYEIQKAVGWIVATGAKAIAASDELAQAILGAVLKSGAAL